MTGIISPFTKVDCPVCGEPTDLSADRDSLAKHIRDVHKDVPLVPITRSLFQVLGQSVPDNLEEIQFDELTTVLANICKDMTNKRGLKNLRK